MATATESRQPTPELFFQTMNAYQRTAALKAAVGLDLFTKIGRARIPWRPWRRSARLPSAEFESSATLW